MWGWNFKMEIFMRLALAFALTLATSPLAAQDLRALAAEYADLPEVQMMWDDVFSPTFLAQQFRLGVPPEIEIPEDKLARIGEVLAAQMELLRPELRDMMVSGMAAEFSAPELEALIAFYKSEHGASVMTKMQPFMANYTAQMMPRMQAMQEAVLPEIIAIVEE